MSTLMSLLKYVLACVPFVLLFWVIGRCNLKKLRRGSQFLMPVLTLLYCIALSVVTLIVGHKLSVLLESGGSMSLLDAWSGNDRSAFLQGVLDSLRVGDDPNVPVYWSLGPIHLREQQIITLVSFLMRYLVVILNTLAMVLFLIFKGICLPILGGIFREGTGLYSATAGHFYDYEEESNMWFLQERWMDFRKLLGAFRLGAAAAAVLLMAAVECFGGSHPGLQTMLYPSFCALILGEMAYVLGGFSASEYNEEVLGADSKSRRVVNLTKLRDSLKHLFGDRLLVEGTQLESASRQGVTDLLEKMAASDETEDRIAASYFQILQKEGQSLDVDCISSSAKLLKGSSVLFCNPFYRDLTQYFLLPMNDTLMHCGKCLVVAGRKSTEPEIRSWLEDALQEHLKMQQLWKVGTVAQEEDCDIGILTFSQLYDLKMIHDKRDFFHKVGLVIILEPSMILATGQLGLSLVVNYCDETGKQPKYCICDRNCDGLVDALSHLIKQSITNVTATEEPTSLHSEMGWHSDGEYLHRRILPDISRYLGVGTELAVASIKEQAPKVVWRSEKKFPVVDMKWIAGQYYAPICQYANIPVSQQSVYASVGFEADLWGTPKEENTCLIVEDEFCNMLEMVRLFLTRGTEQTFVNVISENYLLREYMQDNYKIFSTDQKAIPTVVADYARTERNTAMRLIMMLLMNDSVPNELVEKELRLVGIQSGDLCQTINELILKYTLADPVVVPVVYDDMMGREISSGSEAALRINPWDKDEFRKNIGNAFQTAYYIIEDDKEASSFMDAKLLGHIYQTVLPGQFFTYDGKYYEVRSITAAKGVMVRRAADHIVGRRYYRQKRHYHLQSCDQEGARSRVLSNMEVTICRYEIGVETDGYFELEEQGNLRTAKEIRISNSDQPGSEYLEYTRSYVNKKAMRIRLPGATEEIRYTICLLLMEVFRTFYADSWHYLAAVTPQTEKTRDALRGLLYSVDGEYLDYAGEQEQDCIYIIEDSDLDMGLLESVDRNLTRLMSIVTDYLDWHLEKLNTPDPVPPEPVEITLPREEEKLGFFARLWRKIKNFFRKLFHLGSPEEREQKKTAKKEAKAKKKAEKAEKKRKKKGEAAAPAAESAEAAENEELVETTAHTESAEPAEESAEREKNAAESAQAEDTVLHAETVAEEAPAGTPVPAVDPTGDVAGEDSTAARTQPKNRYARTCYLLFGYDEISPALAVEQTYEYLKEMGLLENELHQARKPAPVKEQETQTEQQCDFCGLPLSGVAYDVLSDGRVRCITCSSSAIETVDEFRNLYGRVLSSMEALYDIRINVPVRVRTVDARAIAKHTGAVFTPTSGYDARVVGFASMDKEGYALFVENGAPRLAAIETISHELTHIWQYISWNQREIQSRYGSGSNRDIVYEGMAMWASIQFLYLIGESEYARRKEQITLQRDDAYGEGFRLYCKKYPLSYTTAMPNETPFRTNPPL